MPGLDHPSPLNKIRSVGARVLKHPTEIKLVEISIFHALHQVGREFEFPVPPIRPNESSRHFFLGMGSFMPAILPHSPPAQPAKCRAGSGVSPSPALGEIPRNWGVTLR
jgi:hypothetical protein